MNKTLTDPYDEHHSRHRAFGLMPPRSATQHGGPSTAPFGRLTACSGPGPVASPSDERSEKSRGRGAPFPFDSLGGICHTTCMTTRLNARVPEDVARKVKYLRARTAASTTEVIIASLEAYYAQVAREEAPARLLEDLIGCADGPGDLSSNYKALLFADKYPLEDSSRPRWRASTKSKGGPSKKAEAKTAEVKKPHRRSKGRS